MKQTGPLEAGSAAEPIALPVQAKTQNDGPRRLPVVHCPVCNSRAHARTSDEMSPTTRLIYYRCSLLECSMAWSATLELATIISPSGISPTFRPAHVKEAKPPGHEFGQAPLLEYLAAITPPT